MPGVASIVYGRGPDGLLRHIEDVESGEACNCVCPDPSCGQALIARKGTKRIHHFAHKRGTCEWAVEYVISAVAEKVVGSSGALAFPELSFRNYFTGSEQTLAASRVMRITSAKLVEESGRGNPDLLVTCADKSGASKQFLVVLSLIHGVSQKSRTALAEARRDAFVVDLKALLKQRKEAAGKHYDRERILVGFQDEAFLADVLTQGDGSCLQWIFNANAEAAAKKSKEEHDAWVAEREKKRKAEEEKRREESEKKRMETEERAARILASKHATEPRGRNERMKGRKRVFPQTRTASEANPAVPLWSEAMPSEEAAERERMASLVLDPKKEAIDSRGRRWYRCELCGRASIEDDFPSIRGWVKDVNLGICRDCM